MHTDPWIKGKFGGGMPNPMKNYGLQIFFKQPIKSVLQKWCLQKSSEEWQPITSKYQDCETYCLFL